MARRQQPTEPPRQDAWDHTPEPDIKWPGSASTEKVILGAILVGGAEQFDKASSIIAQEDMLIHQHQILWRALAQLRDRNEPIDAHTVGMELNATGKLPLIQDGLSWLLELMGGAVELPNIGAYCRKVKELSTRRRLMVTAQAMLVRAQDEAVPVDELILNATTTFADVQSAGGSDDEGKTPLQIVEAFSENIEEFLNPAFRKRGLKTGYRGLDEMLGGGLQDCELIILAARPGCGKSALMLNIAQFITMNPVNPLRADIFSLEMSAQAQIVRLLCGVGRVSNSKFRAGFLNADERYSLQSALKRIIDAPIVIHDTFKRTLNGLLSRMKNAVKKGSKLIALDYAQLMVTGGRSENRNQEIGEIGRALKLFTLDYGTPILLLSQIGRSAEKRPGGQMRAQLSDLKDSGTLEEHSDTVLSIFRPELYSKDRDDLKGVAELDILKQRNGEVGRIPLRFIGNLVRFENSAEAAEYSDSELEPEPVAPSMPLW